MRRMRERMGAIIALVVASMPVVPLPRPLSAQEATSASDELIAAIVRYSFRYEGGNARIIPGSIPDDLTPNFFVPRGTKVLGSVVTGSSVVVLATTSVRPDSLRAEYSRALTPAGWKPFESTSRGGFVENPAHVPLIFCRDGAQLYIIHSRRASESSDLYLHYRDTPGPCDDQRARFRRMDDHPRFPTLYPPSAAVEQSRGRCFEVTHGSRASHGAQTVISANLSAAEVLRHYARQVESEGWRPASDIDRPSAVAAWTRIDSTGRAELLLQVREMRAPGARCHEVEMRVSSARPR